MKRPAGESRGVGSIGAIAALVLAAASTGVIVPALRLLVERTGNGSTAAGVFMASHVLGGIVGAACGAPALRRIGSARSLASAALAASIVVTLAMAALDSLALRVGLRFVDGACHLLAITALVAAATSGDAELRARRAVTMGLAIVLGIAGGLGAGAAIAHPEAALVVSALLSGAALITVVLKVSAEPPPVAEPVSRTPARAPIAPGLLALGERFTFGALSVAAPFLAPPRRVGIVLGVFMTASVVALPLARRYALARGARWLAVVSAAGFALALAVTAAVDVFASAGLAVVWGIPSGAAAGALYASALVLVARSVVLEDRMRAMATVHAAGSAGFALGALCAGTLAFALPGMLVVAVPGIAVLAATGVGVWFLVPGGAAALPLGLPLATARRTPSP